MVVATEKLSKSNPDAVREVFGLLAQSKRKAGLPKPGGIDFLPFGLNGCRAALATMIDYASQQKLIPRGLAVDDLFDATTRPLVP
jgi:4,5-dihydroxyphthalate decarboxylase